METIKKRKRGRKRKRKGAKIKNGLRFQTKRKGMEGQGKTVGKRKGKRIKGKEQIEVYYWVTGERYWEIEPIYQTAGWKFEEGIEKKSSQYLRYWQCSKRTHWITRKTKKLNGSSEENGGGSDSQEVWNRVVTVDQSKLKTPNWFAQ